MPALCRDCLARYPEPPPQRRCPACGGARLLAHPQLDALAIAHLDCDAFYASVEKRDDPSLRDRPVLVGGGHRGVVTTACYLARQYGCRSAMPMATARRLCPHAVVVRPDFTRYVFESRRIMDILRELTPLVQPLSLDEAWVDLSGTERLNGGSPAWQLARVQQRIERETGLNVSVGLAANKFLAKIASDLDKPRGFAVLGAEAAETLAPKPAGVLPGVGPVAVKALARAGLNTVGDLAAADPAELVRRLGPWGLHLRELAHGRDSRAVNPDSDRKGISAETTFFEDHADQAALEQRLGPLCDKVAARARAAGLAGRVATLKLKTADFRILTRRRTLATPTQTAKALFAVTRELLLAETRAGLRYRLIGAGLSDLVEASAVDGGLLDSVDGGEQRARKGEAAVDALKQRFGDAAVVRARRL